MSFDRQDGVGPVYSSLGGDEDLGELVTLFVEEMPDRVAQLLDLLEREDWEQLRQTAHQLKGAGGSYGFHQITPVAARLEEALHGEFAEDRIQEFVEELVQICRLARDGVPC